MKNFWKKHWFDGVMVVVWLLYILFVAKDPGSFLTLSFMIFAHNFVAWTRQGKLK